MSRLVSDVETQCFRWQKAHYLAKSVEKIALLVHPDFTFLSPPPTSWNSANSSNRVETLWSFGSCACFCQPAAESGMEEDPHQKKKKTPAAGVTADSELSAWRSDFSPGDGRIHPVLPPDGDGSLRVPLRKLLGALDGSGEMSVRSAVTKPARDEVAQRQMNPNVKESRPDSFPIPSGWKTAPRRRPPSLRRTCFLQKERKRFRLVLWYPSTSPSRHFLPLLMMLLQFKGLQRELIARN